MRITGRPANPAESLPAQQPRFRRRIMDRVSLICFLASYGVAFGLELSRFLRRIPSVRFLTLGIATAGLIAHTVYLLNRSKAAQLPPLLSSSHDWLLVLAWLIVVLYLFLSLIDRDVALGVFLLPLVLLLNAAASLVSDEHANLLDARSGWIMLHSSLLVLGTSGVVLGLVLSLMYLVQHTRLKHRQAHYEGLSLPSLARLDRWNRWCVVISVPLLTLGMATGVIMGVYLSDAPESVSFTDPLILGYGVVWLVSAALFVWLIRSWKRSTPGRRVAALTAWAFGFLLITLVGLQMLTGTSLQTWHASRAAGVGAPSV